MAQAANEAAATYTGTNNGAYSNPANWSTNPVVPIDTATNIYDVTIPSKTVAYNLSGSGQLNTLMMSSSTLNLNSGCNLSVLNGGAITLSHINATNASFTDTESVSNLTSTSLSATSGGSVDFTALTIFATNSSSSATFTASGSQSKMLLPALNTISENAANVSVVASAGGDVELPALNTITYSGSIFENLTLQSSGTNSVIDAPQLGSNTMSRLEVTVQNAGTLNWGSPTAIQDSSITLGTSGTINTANFTSLTSTNLTANNGAALSFPAVTTLAVDSNFAESATITASGSGSLVSLPLATSLSENSNSFTVTANNGGDIEIPKLQTLNYTGSIFENLTINVSGSKSIVNASSLAQATLLHLNVDVATGGTLNWGSPTTITDSSLTLDTAGTINTASFTSLTSTNLTATNGVTFSFPAVTTLAIDSDFAASATFTASNSGSVLSLPLATSLSENSNSLTISATNGGDVELPKLQTLNYTGSIFENLTINATGSGSVVNLSSLAQAKLLHLNVDVATGGTLNWGSPATIQDSSITLDTAGTINSASFTSITSTNVTATNGVTFSFPNVTTVATDSNFASSETLTATAAGSRLLFNNLTTVAESGSSAGLSAQNGGDVEAPNLTTVTYSGSVFEGFTLNATGSSSIINVPKLGSGPLTRLTVTVATGGTLNWGSPTTIQDSKITLNTSGTLNTASITNLDSTSLTVTNGGSLTFPAMKTYGTNSTGSATFTSQNTSSGLYLPNLTTVHEDGWGLTLSASAGGYLDLHSLSQVTGSGSVFEDFDVTSANAGSEVNLSSLDSTLGMSNSLALTDNGMVLLGAGAGSGFLSFQADFTNANGPLDIYLNNALIDVIQPNNLSVTESYNVYFPADLLANGVVEFQSSGSNSGVTVSNYAAVPEPLSLTTCLAAASLLCLGRRRYQHAVSS